MRRRLLTLALTTTTALFVLAAPALAYNDGRGWYGEAPDKVVTNFGFLLIVFFPTFCLVASLIQWRLEKRKHARHDAHVAQAQNADWRGGW
jgi:ABC-type nickel/cobalt efflux system permease component RcnA